MTTSSIHRPTTEEILKLLEKWQPEMVTSIPAEDHYGLRSIQPIVLKAARELPVVIVAWTIFAIFTLVYAPQLKPDAVPEFRQFAVILLTVVQLAAWFCVIRALWLMGVEWVRYRIQPIYVSHHLGQLFVGQRGYAILGMSDSKPDTADLQNREVTTPDQPYYIRLFFWSNQQVLLPENDKRKSGYIIIVPQEAAEKIYAVQGHYQEQRSIALQVPATSLQVQRETLEKIERLPDNIVQAFSGFTLSLSDDATTPVQTSPSADNSIRSTVEGND